MKHYFSIALITIASSFLLLNCDCKRLCNNPMPTAHFVNFDSADLHAVIIKQFVSDDGSFSHLQSTQVYSNAVENGMDTLRFGNNEILLGSYNDFTITIPAVNRTWNVSKMGSHMDKRNAQACTSGMTYYLNDTMYVLAANPMIPNQAGVITITK